MYLFFDTETTGKYDYKAPVNAAHQPNICQIGLIVTDAEGRVKAELNTLIKPKDWKMSPEAAAIHGITEEDCQKYGLSMSAVIEIIRRMAEPATVLVAHNIEFDVSMVRREAVATGRDMPFCEDASLFCTMQETTDLLKLPGKYGFKWPKLQETYKFLFGEEFEGAHDAMADIRACMRCFFELKKRREESAAA